MRDDAWTDLGKLDFQEQERVRGRLVWLAENFNHIVLVPLAGSLRGNFKFRVGDVRVIYGIRYDEKIIVVRAIGRRDKIYD
jgi:mRNA-degrading endonuclease RelE of RelBE toxin-antitoxin system